MNTFSYKSVMYAKSPSQEDSLFILRQLADAATNSSSELIDLNDLLHRFMYYGPSRTNFCYKRELKKFNTAALWLYIHGVITIVGDEGVSLNHDISSISPSKIDIKTFKYALAVASYEFNKSVNYDLEVTTKMAHA